MGTTLFIIFVVYHILALAFTAFLLKRILHKATPNKGFIRTGIGGTTVVVNGRLIVLPFIQQVQEVDTSSRTLIIQLSGDMGLICKNGNKVALKVTFHIHIPQERAALLIAFEKLGAGACADVAALQRLLEPTLTAALHAVGKCFEAAKFQTETAAIKIALIDAIGTQLHGYQLEAIELDSIPATSTTHLQSLHTIRYADTSPLSKPYYSIKQKQLNYG